MLRSYVALTLVGLSLPAAASAAPITLNLARPDITSGFLSLSYNATSDIMSVTGSALSIDFNGVAPPDHAITGGTFTLNATINASGVLTGGTLTITGSVGAIGATSPLLTANLTQFGFSSSPLTQLFQFVGTVTGGSQAAAFGPTMGTILNTGGGFNGTFNSNFSNGANFGQSVADTARIPLPGTGAAAAGLVLLAARRRRR